MWCQENPRGEWDSNQQSPIKQWNKLTNNDKMPWNKDYDSFNPFNLKPKGKRSNTNKTEINFIYLALNT